MRLTLPPRRGQVGGEFNAAAGFKIGTVDPVTVDLGPEALFSGHLADITIFIGPIPLTVRARLRRLSSLSVFHS